MNTKNLRRLWVILALAGALGGSLEARTKKGDKYLKQGNASEALQRWDEALDFYEQAQATDPADPGYLLAVRRARFQAAQQHVDAGLKLRTQGQLEAAATEFQKAILRDPGSAIALQEWKRTSEMLDREKNGKKLEGPDRGLTSADEARKEMDERAAAILPPPELKPISQLPSTLKMNNQPPKVLYETIGKLAGVNVVFDPTYTNTSGKNFNLDLSNASIDQALDYVAILTKTFWKPISANTIFVTEDNVTKRRDYEDNVVRVFYIQNATSVQEFQEIATAVRSLTEIRRVFTYNAQHAILMRGTPDQIALAEKLIYDLDKAKAEVVVDVLVMEANRSHTRDLAAALTSAGTPGLNMPIGFTPRNPVLVSGSTSTTGTTPTGTTGTTTGTTGSNLISLAQIGHVSTNDFSTTLPGALLQLVVSDRQTRILQSPQVRASDGQKVTLRIGDKIPYATGAFQSGLGGVGGLGLANTQFNFAEVGVNVDITPTVHGRDEVTLKVAIEVSTVKDRVSIGGIEQPVIGQRRSETEIRLKEGEVNILGGLSQDQSTKSISGIPGLVNIPLLGKLLGSESTDKERGELLIAMIPHIVRTPDLTAADLRGVAAGSDQVVRVTYAPQAAPPAPTGAPPAATTTVPQTGGTGGVAPATTPSTAPQTPAPATPAPATTVPLPPGAAPPPPPAPGTQPLAAQPSGAPRLLFAPATVETPLGGPVNLTLQVESVSDLFSASPVRIKWDPKVLRLNDITPGDFLSHDNQKITSAKDIRNDAGEAWVTLNRLPGAGGVSGSGALGTFSFTAIGKGKTNVTVTDFGLRNAQLQPINVTAPEVPVAVQ